MTTIYFLRKLWIAKPMKELRSALQIRFVFHKSWTMCQPRWCVTSEPHNYVWRAGCLTYNASNSKQHCSTFQWITCVNKHPQKTWLMTTLTVMFELHIILTLSLVLKSVFSNSATCSSSSLNKQNNSENYRVNTKILHLSNIIYTFYDKLNFFPTK